jgi:hypothetical protein
MNLQTYLTWAETAEQSSAQAAALIQSDAAWLLATRAHELLGQARKWQAGERPTSVAVQQAAEAWTDLARAWNGIQRELFQKWFRPGDHQGKMQAREGEKVALQASRDCEEAARAAGGE